MKLLAVSAAALVVAAWALALPGGAVAQPVDPPVAHRITQATAAGDLFSGTDAVGGIGDWYLSNGVVEAIVDDITFQIDLLKAGGPLLAAQNGVARSGGSVVDLGLVGYDNDQLVSITPVINLNGNLAVVYLPAYFVTGDSTLPSIVARADAESASLSVYGLAITKVGAPPLHVETTYSVRPGEPFLRIRTELRNDTAVALPAQSFGDMFLHAGGGGTIPYTASPRRGFRLDPVPVMAIHHSVLGRLDPGDGMVDTDAGRPVGGVSYTVISLETKLLLVGQNKSVSLAGSPFRSQPLEPGQSVSYERRVYVGARNDVAASADPALRDWLAALGVPSGTVRGRLESADGNDFRATLEVIHQDLLTHTPQPETFLAAATGDTSPVPTSHMLTDAARGGAFEALLPVGRHELHIDVEERDAVAPIVFEVRPDQITDLGSIPLSQTGALRIAVHDATSGLPLPARITLKGWGVPDPVLGVPLEMIDGDHPLRIGAYGRIPYANQTYTDPSTGIADVTLRPGRYRVIASHGPEWSMDWGEVVVTAKGSHELGLALDRVVETPGWLAADFHIHAAPSADSSVPPEDRVRSYVAEGVELMVSSDHDYVFDYAPVIAALGLDEVVTSMVGVEVSSSADFNIFETSAGHINGWPLTVQPDQRKNGAPEDFRVEPSVIYDRLRGLGAEVVQLNHPTWTNNGFLKSMGFDPTLPITTPPNDFLLRPSALGTGTRNLDFDVLEVQNGIDRRSNVTARAAWLSLLNQGFVRTGTAASDSHRIADQVPGYPRTYVAYAGAEGPAFDATAFNDALKALRAFGTSGPFLEVEASTDTASAGLGETLSASTCCATLRVRVRAPCWMPVGRVKVLANGDPFAELPADAACTSTLRVDESLTLDPAIDTHYVVTVEENLPRTPPGGYDAALYLFAYPTVIFEAFTNPIFLDVDGNGVFDPPGI